ncbi:MULTISPECIES: hypothetical protein [Pseudomonas]|uniref:Uncharacterized protein n=1 Tax=Pseudomonas reactans TaxID=117680 RepID=A0A7Y8FZM1_9PSED|nr:hypothetical protein [Pseudomonas reactans]NWE87968.1 hypothetical protein [Pseudomonas reactans]
MIKDRVIWGGCIGLFLAGGLFAYGFSVSSFESLKVVDLFAIISAIATAFAAFAARSAASAARKQSFDSAVSIRRQIHKTHVDSFNEWLDGMESDLGVKFYRRYELYEIIFPNNRNPALEFSEIGSEQVKSWQLSYSKLVDITWKPSRLSLREMEGWVFDIARITGYMRLSLLPSQSKQIRLDGRLPTGVSSDNYKRALPIMGVVLSSLSKFAFVDGRSSDRGISIEFEESFSDFVNAICNRSYNQHTYKSVTV